ncbi:MAG: hypothetical protein AMXMBFR61_00410 [Fimbriimonadales bacterium]
MRVARSYKRKPRHFPWRWIWILVIVAEVVAAPFTSPWTGLRTVVVVGADVGDRAWLASVLRPWAGTPALSLDRKSLERELLKEPRLKNVRIARGLDGRMTLHLTYRQPYARWQGPDWSVEIDADGVPFRRSAVLRPYRIVSMRPTPPPLGRRVDTLQVPLEILHFLRANDLARQATITVDRSGEICLNMPASAPVHFGSGENVSEKLATLRSILGRDPTLLARAEYLDLKHPGAPALKMKRQQENDSQEAAKEAASDGPLHKEDPAE